MRLIQIDFLTSLLLLCSQLHLLNWRFTPNKLIIWSTPYFTGTLKILLRFEILNISWWPPHFLLHYVINLPTSFLEIDKNELFAINNLKLFSVGQRMALLTMNVKNTVLRKIIVTTGVVISSTVWLLIDVQSITIRIARKEPVQVEVLAGITTMWRPMWALLESPWWQNLTTIITPTTTINPRQGSAKALAYSHPASQGFLLSSATLLRVSRSVVVLAVVPELSFA